MRRLALATLLFLAACQKPPQQQVQPSQKEQFVIEVDIDDHGLKALWDAQAPNLKRMIAQGALAYTRVVVPTHSNQSNMTLVSGDYPDGHNVPSNAYLNRADNYNAGLSLAGLQVGDYVFYDKNPFNAAAAHHVDTVWSATHAAGLSNAFFGELPPWEVGTDAAHYTLAGASLYGITLDRTTVKNLLTNTLRYPSALVNDASKTFLDGPPDNGETLAHFTFRDAAQVWKAAVAAGQKPPRYMFIWAFIALDGNPTDKFGGDGPELAKVVDDYDAALGQLLDAIDASPYKGQVNILFTLDHGKTNATSQVDLGEGDSDGQLGNLVATYGFRHHVFPGDYKLLNEDGDALVYAKCDNAGTPAGAARQQEIAHGLVELIQSGALVGVDTSRTITWDGYLGTRRMHDYHIEGPNQADVIVFPQTGWTLNNVDHVAGPHAIDPTVHPNPYGRHGGFSEDELYVPLIMWGPAFKPGVLVPHPVNHVDVAATAMKVLGQPLGDAQGAPVEAALVGGDAEALANPGELRNARDLVLSLAGYGGEPKLASAPAQQAVVVDVAGLYDDEVFRDAATSPHAKALADLAKQGTRFASAWNRSRSWAENEYDLLAGGAPTHALPAGAGSWRGEAEADPTWVAAPGLGLMQLPAPALGTVPNPEALTAWRAQSVWGQESLLSAVSQAGYTVAVLGAPDYHLNHLALPTGAQQPAGDPASTLGSFLQANTKAVAVVTLGGKRTGDRKSAAAGTELEALAKQVADLRAAAPNALFIVTSRGAADVDDAASDQFGPQSGRHVPFIVLGPNVRAGAVTGQPATAADVPATVLFGLGLPTSTDFVEGTWAKGSVGSGGTPQPTPASATGGHALLRAFKLQ